MVPVVRRPGTAVNENDRLLARPSSFEHTGSQPKRVKVALADERSAIGGR